MYHHKGCPYRSRSSLFAEAWVCRGGRRGDKCSRSSAWQLHLRIKRTLLSFLPLHKLSSSVFEAKRVPISVCPTSTSDEERHRSQFPWPPSERACLVFSECNTAQSLSWKTCQHVNLSSFDIITLSLRDIWKTNDYVMHKVDMTNSFTYERTLSDLERTGWGRKHTRDLSQTDISPPACSHLPGESLVSTPQSGTRLQRHTSSTSKPRHDCTI